MVEKVGKSSEKMSEALKGFTDCHCHILPALDDGPGSINESIEMARVLSSLGFNEIYCTPHLMKGVFDNHKKRIEKSVLDLKTTLNESGIALTLHAAVEYCLDEFLLDSLDQPMSMGENLVLVEAYRQVQPQFLAETLYKVIVLKRLRPLIAHPERYDLFDSVLSSINKSGPLSMLRQWMNLDQSDRKISRPLPDAIEPINTLREMGCLFQGNIGSFAGMYGEQVRARAIQLMQLGFYDRLGTDGHSPRKLAHWLDKGLRVVTDLVGDKGLSRLLRPMEVLVHTT